MDITIDNFAEQLPVIQGLISKSLFISFDEEMTGIYSHEYRNSKDDTPDIRYRKMTYIASKYSIIQVGLCFFCLEDEESGNNNINSRLVAYPYTIYMFPSNGKDIVLSPSSIDFLKKNNMDFDKWIVKGLSYTDADGDQYAYNKNVATHQKNLDDYIKSQTVQPEQTQESSQPPVDSTNTSRKQDIILTKESDIAFMKKNFDSLDVYIQNNDFSEPHPFDSCNSYLRRVIYQTVDNKYPNVVVSPSKDNQNVLVAVVTSSSDKMTILQQKLDDGVKAYEKYIGFRMIYKAIVKAKVPVIGHNCMYDIMFLLRACDGVLHDSLTGFKQNLQNIFPIVYDTKYLASSGCLDYVLNDTTLCDVYDAYKKRSPVDAATSSSSSSSMESDASTCSSSAADSLYCTINFAEGVDMTNQFHNAGYDAYCTGFVFGQQVADYRQHLINTQVIDSSTSYSSVLTNHLNNVAANKLFMMQSLYHMNLSANESSDIIKAKGAVLFIKWTSTSNVNNNDVVNLFTSIGIAQNDLDLLWLDGSSLLVDVISSQYAQCKDKNDPDCELVNKLADDLTAQHGASGFMFAGFWKYKRDQELEREARLREEQLKKEEEQRTKEEMEMEKEKEKQDEHHGTILNSLVHPFVGMFNRLWSSSSSSEGTSLSGKRQRVDSTDDNEKKTSKSTRVN